tara:strand:+ start:256 stop:393 length:138 start_codon:yes stop_codon:yes gene_type:complete
MKNTIDYLISSQRAQDLDKLMGSNLDWQHGETKTGTQYYKLYGHE